MKGRRSTLRIERAYPYLYSFPFFLVVVFFMIAPFLLNLILSFTDYSLTRTSPNFVGISNYIRAFAGNTFEKALGRSFVFTAGCLFLSMVVGMFFAVGMSFDIKGINFIKAIILLPWILPESITAYVWKWLFSADTGIIYMWLLQIGIIGENTSFFADGNLAMLMIILSNAWRTAPFIAVMLYAKLKSIPKEQIEAAQIDGANVIDVFLRITIPWLMPIIQRCCLLLFVWSFNSFSIIYIMTFGGPAGATTTLPFLIRQTAFKSYNFSKAMSYSILTFIVICASLMVFYCIARIGRIIREKRRIQ